MNSIFITGIGTDVGKTIVAAILTEALEADYWKPVQAGYNTATDSEFIHSIIGNKKTTVHPETYKLKLAASPHIAAREEGIELNLDTIHEEFTKISTWSTANGQQYLIIEGAGGLMVPLNKDEFVIDLVKKLNTKVILVSRNYLGSINHSLLTASVCKQHNIDVLGWIFNDHYMNYEDEIVQWSDYPKIISIPFEKNINKVFITHEAAKLKAIIASYL